MHSIYQTGRLNKAMSLCNRRQVGRTDGVQTWLSIGIHRDDTMRTEALSSALAWMFVRQAN